MIDSDPGSVLRFHDWRALTVNLLSISQHQEQQRDNLQVIVDEVYNVLGYKAKDATSSSKALLGIVEAAVSFSRTLRKQRACWSIRLPKIKGQKDGTVHAADYNTTEMMHEKFDKDNFQRQNSGEPLVDGFVIFFITPALFKLGMGDGRQFDEEEQVFRKAKVKAAGKVPVSRSEDLNIREHWRGM